MLANKYKRMIELMEENASSGDIKRMISHIENYDSPALGTKVVRLSQMKSYLKTTRPHWVKYIKFDPLDIDAYHQISRERLRERENFFVKKIWIRQILSWFNSDHLGRRICALQLISGRRISEILGSTFVIVDNYTIGSRDLSKKRNNNALQMITLLQPYNSRDWMNLLSTTRACAAQFSSDRSRKRANRALRLDVDSGLTSHKLRGIYANLMWRLSGMHRIKTGYIQDVLNLESQEIAIFYSSFLLE
jgi:hypothetical protein